MSRRSMSGVGQLVDEPVEPLADLLLGDDRGA
jgi:hypothetical protein